MTCSLCKTSKSNLVAAIKLAAHAGGCRVLLKLDSDGMHAMASEQHSPTPMNQPIEEAHCIQT